MLGPSSLTHWNPAPVILTLLSVPDDTLPLLDFPLCQFLSVQTLQNVSPMFTPMFLRSWYFSSLHPCSVICKCVEQNPFLATFCECTVLFHCTNTVSPATLWDAYLWACVEAQPPKLRVVPYRTRDRIKWTGDLEIKDLGSKRSASFHDLGTS